MKYFGLVWAGLWRRPVRTVLTLLSIAIAFLLFGFIQGVGSAFGAVQERLRADRLVTSNVSLLPLPMAYRSRVEQTPGVVEVAPVAMFFAHYQDPKNFVMPMAVDLQSLFAIHPEWILADEHRRAMATNRIGAIIGTRMAQKFGWQVGDRIPLLSQTMKADGGVDWVFEMVGTYDSQDTSGETQGFFINYEYFDAARLLEKGTVVQYLTLIENPSEAAVVADAIDRIFENSGSQTKTQTEKDAVQSRLTQVGNVEFFVKVILVAVFFALLFLTANTMAQSVRERVGEFAALKALGFPDGHIVALVLTESAALFIGGAIVGLSAAGAALSVVTIPLLTPQISLPVLLLAAMACVLMAAVSTVVPAWRARQLSIVDALRRG